MESGSRPPIEIGRIHLTVADLDRALAFYTSTLGFEVTQRRGDAAILGAGDRQHLIELQVPAAGARPPAWAGQPPGRSRVALRYPDRPSLAGALERLGRWGLDPDAAVDHGMREALYVRDPDGHMVELYWERPREEWPESADDSPDVPLDLAALAGAATGEDARAADYAPMSDATRRQLRGLRAALLHLHKVLLDDTRQAYEMDRGRVGSNANLLQLVINDPWFAWLHALSELVVRMDQALAADVPSTDADATGLADQVEQLLTASEAGEGFSRRYYEALQRQPAVVLAHADVRRRLKDIR